MRELLHCMLIRFAVSAAFGRKEGHSISLHDFATPISTQAIQAGLQQSDCSAFVSHKGNQCCMIYLLKQREKRRNEWQQNRCDRLRKKLNAAMIRFQKSPRQITTTKRPARKSKPTANSMQALAAFSLRAKRCNAHTDCPVQQFCGAPDPDEDPQSRPLCFKCSGCERDVDGVTPCSVYCGRASSKAAVLRGARAVRRDGAAPKHGACQKHTDCAAHQFCAAADLEEDPHSTPKCFTCLGGCEFDVDGVSPCRKHCALAAGSVGAALVSAQRCAAHSDCSLQHFCGAADPEEDPLDKPICYACAECERDVDGVTPCIRWCTDSIRSKAR